ncbi:MAG: archaeal flagellar protein FlaF [Methanolobus sp.]|jgi:flagellar protein FlaF|uniref:Putative archaeal flagellar protein F n=1 Tax=Methanolobus tindarius DSM 2278 TaxID=1090322 RepID=W9DQ97_METTI|nr:MULTISPECIES: flagellar protein F [Methanolobus]ETA67475.1 putative archaeal flagellar protein F [Methanolobus tindarius DSM 2278]MDI3486266.1 archaeal flagellar protein FlaF [Methanolobus sp.]MDK2831816.1 archaeal flagellar protein FlaF [Methanolobus sp.]MDK2939309.1 archaeal flagellar protein FlaF [Methanolobus sp.]
MGFEISVVAVMFFITALVVGSFSYSMLNTSNDIVNDASEEQYQMQNSKLKTNIEVESAVPGNYSGTYNLTVTLSNTGSETVLFDELNVLVDGNLESYVYSDVAATWTPAETRNMTVTDLSGTGSHRVKVVTRNGVSAYSSYVV